MYNVQVKFSIHSGDSRHVSNKEFKMRSKITKTEKDGERFKALKDKSVVF